MKHRVALHIRGLSAKQAWMIWSMNSIAKIMFLLNCSPEVQKLFDKYTPDGVIARRLPRSNALKLLDVELGMTGERAEELFDHFDADQNGYMSLWEFQHFVNVIGSRWELCSHPDKAFTRASFPISHDRNRLRRGLLSPTKTIATAANLYLAGVNYCNEKKGLRSALSFLHTQVSKGSFHKAILPSDQYFLVNI